MMYNTKNPLEVQNLRLKIEKLIEKQSMVEVVEKKAKTLQQLKYLHTILAYFGLQTGNTLDEVKTCYFKRIVNRDLFVRRSTMICSEQIGNMLYRPQSLRKKSCLRLSNVSGTGLVMSPEYTFLLLKST